ncbi:hypothetical protein ACIQ6U_10805 [Lysinibacillus fusiformis]
MPLLLPPLGLAIIIAVGLIDIGATDQALRNVDYGLNGQVQ